MVRNCNDCLPAVTLLLVCCIGSFARISVAKRRIRSMRENGMAQAVRQQSRTVRKVKKYTGTAVMWTIMLLLTVLVLYPLLFVFSTSFKTYGTPLAIRVTLIPVGLMSLLIYIAVV